MAKSQKPILVLGGTGHYGRHIVASLAKRAPVRVLSRNKAKARLIVGEPVEIVEGDVTSEESVAAALQGVGGVVIGISAFTPKLIRKQWLIERDSVLTAFALAEKTGIGRVVYISGYDVRDDLPPDLDFPTGRIKVEVEKALCRSRLNWTVLGAAPSMEIFFAMKKGSRMLVPGGGPPALHTVSPVDVGEIAAQAVLRDDLRHQRIRLTGPEALSFREAAARISAVTGKPLSVVKVPLFGLKVVAAATKPFNPFVSNLLAAVKLLNRFPQELARQVPVDHERLRSTFDYTPTTLEMEARRRLT